MRLILTLVLLAAPGLAAAFDAIGLALGAGEQAVLKRFPSAHCKPLDWKSRAADRRCDDAQVSVDGIGAKITVYLRADAVQAYDLRFGAEETPQLMIYLRKRWGAPGAEATELIQRKDKAAREIYKASWTRGEERAVLVSQKSRKRATLSVSRGNFEEEIYRVR